MTKAKYLELIDTLPIAEEAPLWDSLREHLYEELEAVFLRPVVKSQDDLVAKVTIDPALVEEVLTSELQTAHDIAKQLLSPVPGSSDSVPCGGSNSRS
jgi:hypothetical protein